MPTQEIADPQTGKQDDEQEKSFRDSLLESLRASGLHDQDTKDQSSKSVIPDEINIREKNGDTFQVGGSGNTDQRLNAYLEERGFMLKDADLSASKISDAGLLLLRKAPNLGTLMLQDTQIGDAGMESLAKTRPGKLSEINLHSTRVGDDGVRELAKIRSLQKLNLNDTLVTDEGAAALKTIKSLQVLSLDYSAITDQGVAALKDSPSLRSLSLKGCPITDESAKDLIAFKNLMVLNLEDTHMSSETAKWIQKMMPNCIVTGPDGQGAPQASQPNRLLKFNHRHRR